MSAPSPSAPQPGSTATARSDETPNFADLVEAHRERLCNFLLRYTRNRQDAEDLAQDTFVKAYKAFDRFDPRQSFAAWLYTIARRTAYNHFRDHRPTQELAFDVMSDGESPDTSAERSDERDSIWEKVRRLKSPYSEVLMLKYVDDLSVEDIARILGRSQTGVKILLFRARHQLRALTSRPPAP